MESLLTMEKVKERLSPVTKLSYGVGDFGFAFADTAVGVLFAIFLTDVVGLDASIIMHPRIWEASGHTSTFSDLMVDCLLTKKRFRADQVEPQSGTAFFYTGANDTGSGKECQDAFSVLLPAGKPDAWQVVRMSVAAELRRTGLGKQMLEALEQEKLQQERRRLLYVAATRAERWLHLFGSAQVQETDDGPVVRQPPRNSALGLLWPAVGHEFTARLADLLSHFAVSTGNFNQRRRRIVDDRIGNG